MYSWCDYEYDYGDEDEPEFVWGPLELDRPMQSRAGDLVRIYATDGAGDCPIHGAVRQGGNWFACQWDKDGRHDSDFEDGDERNWSPSGLDLVNVPSAGEDSMQHWFCEECEVVFGREVWHCLKCNQHSPMQRDSCLYCGDDGEDSPVTREVRRRRSRPVTVWHWREDKASVCGTCRKPQEDDSTVCSHCDNEWLLNDSEWRVRREEQSHA